MRRQSRIVVPFSEIEFVGFGLSGDDNNLKTGVANVVSHDLFEDGIPVNGGVYDARMGTSDYLYRCWTCAQQKQQCLGHPGVLRLNAYIEQPMMVAEIRRWLRITCFKCGTPIVDLEKYRPSPKALRLKEMASAVPDFKKCPNCQAVHPKIERNSDDNFSFGYRKSPEEDVKHLYPEKIRKVFERIADSVVKFMGRKRSRPTDLILRVAQVPPVTIRPSIKTVGSGVASYHNTTNLIQNLVKMNNMMPDKKSVSENEYLRASLNLRQLYYELIYGSPVSKVRGAGVGKRAILPALNSQESVSILRRFPRKEGRIRKSLTGKRVWSMGRSTISGNNKLKPYEVGCPKNMARILQVKETVQEYNKEMMMQYFINGRKQYPGCSRIRKKSTGAIHDVSTLQRDFRLEIGDVIWRDAITGDIGLYNRQPSLERSSTSGNKIVVLEDDNDKTLQMNVTACAFYGADFDGDQMSLIVPSEVASRAETRFMSSVTNWFISTKNSSPVTGQIQDSVVGMMEMSRDNVFMDRFHAMMMFQGCRMPPPRILGTKASVLTGREVISILLERYPINFTKKPTMYNDTFIPYVRFGRNEKLVTVRNGELMSGILDKSSIGGGMNEGIFHIISRKYGSKVGFDMIFAVQRMAIQFLLNRGFSISTNDMMVFPEQSNDIKKIVAELRKNSEIITGKMISGNLPPPIGMTVHEFYEKSQREALRIPDEILEPVLRYVFTSSNGLFKMISSGSKGSKANLIHIMGFIGQVEINQQRIQELFSFRRTLPTFPRFATAPEAYGFVANSYIVGMSSSECVFAFMNGRFDLITKALSTSVTGTFQRKNMLCLQSILSNNFRMCTKANKIYSLLYGDSGFDTRKIQSVNFDTVAMTDAALEEAYKVDVSKLGFKGTAAEKDALQKACDKMFDEVLTNRDTFRKIYQDMENSTFNQPMTSRKYLPLNIDEYLADKNLRSERQAKDAPTCLLRMIEEVEDFMRRLPYLFINEIQESSGGYIPSYLNATCFLLRMHMREKLSPRFLASTSPKVLSFILEKVRFFMSVSLIDYGTAVGVLASQGISEPLTQYMLDSHHRSVSEGTNKSGMVRVHEIYEAKPVAKEQSSEMLLRVAEEFEEDKYKVQEIANNIKFISLERFVRRYAILFEPYKKFSYPPFKSDIEWVEEFEKMFPGIKPSGKITNWCIWVDISRSSLILNSVSLETIVGKIRLDNPNVFVVHTSENAPNVRMRIYVESELLGRSDPEQQVREIVNKLLKTPIRGIRGIRDAWSVTAIRHFVNRETGGLERKNIYAIKTVGTNFRSVVKNNFIDSYKSVSSSVGDTLSILGIEAARQKIINETTRFMADRTPSLSHLILIADVMTQTGRVTSLEKSGMSARDKTDILSRMPIGGPIQVLIEAVTNNVENNVESVSGRLLLGGTPKLGTRYNRIFVDSEYVSKNTVGVDSILDSMLNP